MGILKTIFNHLFKNNSFKITGYCHMCGMPKYGNDKYCCIACKEVKKKK